MCSTITNISHKITSSFVERLTVRLDVLVVLTEQVLVVVGDLEVAPAVPRVGVMVVPGLDPVNLADTHLHHR